MAEEEEGRNKKISEVKAIGNSWIICRSQSHSGRVYYFNTLTGKSAWNLSDGETEKAQLLSGASGTLVGDCPEPAEPPGDTPHCSSHQNAPHNDGGARIYNKQIINNQFAKPFEIPPLQNINCSCGSLNPMNDIRMNLAPAYNPALWAMPPTHQVYLASPISTLANQAQPYFNNTNVPVQNSSVPIPNYFQMGNQLANQNPQHNQGFHNTKLNKYPPRWNQNSQRNFQNNSNNDLRDILSARRKDQRSYLEETEQTEIYENNGNNLHSESEKSKLTADDLHTSDIDEEWLEANTIGDISCAWREFSGADCCIVVANTHVMLNNRKFLSHFIKPEEKIYLLTPLEVIKQLRSATGDTDSGSRLAQRARYAIRFAVLQMDKVPAGLKNLQNRSIETCCIELVEQNYHVLLLVNGDELLSQMNIEGVSMFTIYQFKEYLNANCNKLKPGIHENITVTIRQNNGVSEKTINQSTPEATTFDHAEIMDELNVQHKEIEVQTEQIKPVKKTVNACVQTDFEVTPTLEILKSPILMQSFNKEIMKSRMLDQTSNTEILKSTAVQTLNTEMAKSPVAVQPLSIEILKSPHLNEPSKIVQNLKTDMIAKASNDTKKETEVVTRKIRLKRNNVATATSPVKKNQFRWRKQRAKPPLIATASSKAVVLNNQSFPMKSPPSSLISISDLLPPPNDNISDIAKSIEFSDASIVKTPEAVVREVIEESSLDVISNSIDDDTIPKISKNAILNESKDNEKEDIVMFEVTSDIIDDNISRGCDEWVSRFGQIMEEALTQILQQEPRFLDPALPPPWTVYEATVCVKKKFKDNYKIALACDECSAFLLKISDGRGKIFADLSPPDFMRLYSYGVYLIAALQSVLNDCEDLKIAKASLSELLEDITNPNVFLDQTVSDRQDYTANVSDLVTDLRDDFATAANISPPRQKKHIPIGPSPSKYNLRSSQRSNEQNVIRVPGGFQNTNVDESFFTCLQLRKNSTSSDSRLPAETLFSPPQQICLPNHNLTSGSKEDTDEKEVRSPKIIRKFNFRPDIEEKLKSRSNYSDDNTDYYYGDELFMDDNYYKSNNKSDSITHYGSDDLSCTKSDMIGAQIFQWFTQRTTYQVHKVLTEVHSFCENSCMDLHSKEKMDQQYKINLMEKATKLHICLNNLCNNLNSVLCRKDTMAKVRNMLAELGFNNCEISDTQVAEYGELVQKYLDQANILIESLNLIATAIREKE